MQSTKVPAPELTSAEVVDSPSTRIEQVSVQENPFANTEPQPAAPTVTLTVTEFVKSSVQDILTTIQLTQSTFFILPNKSFISKIIKNILTSLNWIFILKTKNHRYKIIDIILKLKIFQSDF